LSAVNAVDLVVYETVNLVKELPEFDLPVFTSPSNVDAYFHVNPSARFHAAVAMGGATASRLKHYGVRNIQQPDAFDDLGLVTAVMRLSIKE
jgi:hydroxymethylbilane synthase